MKKAALAVVIPVLLASGAVQAGTIYQGEDGSTIDLYGRLAFNITDKGSEDVEGKFDARLGIGGSQTVNDTVSVIGWAEYQVGAAEFANNLNDEDELTARYVWAGIDGAEYGRLTGGRVASGLIMFTDIVDVFAASDIAVARQVGVVDATATQVFRQDGTVQYQNSFDYFDVSAAYIIGNNTSDLDTAYNLALRYTFNMGDAGKLAPVAIYQYDEGESGDEYYVWGIGASYYIGDVVLGVVYSEDEVEKVGVVDKSKDEVVEASIVYDLNDWWVLRAGYRWLENSGGDELELSDTTLEAQYRLTTRSSIFGSYVFRDGDNGTSAGYSGDADDDYFFLGLRYEY